MRLSASTLVAAATWLLAAPAAAFEVTLDGTGSPVRWPDGLRELVVHAPPARLGVPRPQAMRAANAAVAAWNEALGGAVTLAAVESRGEGAVGYDPAAGAANENAIFFEDGEWPYDPRMLAVTIVTVDLRRHAIVDADIVVRTDRRWALLADGNEVGGRVHDLQNALTHELGHLVGLAHSVAAPEVVMYPASTPGETLKRHLAPDDRDGAGFLYLGALGSPELEQLPATGCAAAGSSAPTAASLALLALLLLARRGLHRAAPAAAALALLLPAAASAGEPAPERLALASAAAALPASADAVVHGVVLQSRTFLAGKRLFTTESVVEVKGCTGGCEQRVVVRQPGGRIGDLEQLVEGSTPLAAGDEVVAVLRAIPGLAAYRIVGLDRGLLRLSVPAAATTAPAAIPSDLPHLPQPRSTP